MVSILLALLAGTGENWETFAQAYEMSAGRIILDFRIEQTTFDTGVSLKNGPGLAFSAGLRTNDAILGLGYSLIATKNRITDDAPEPSGVHIQTLNIFYTSRLMHHREFFADFTMRIGHRFYHSGLERDTAPFVGLGGSAGLKVGREVEVEFGIMTDHISTHFNRKHTHLFHDYTYSLGITAKF